MSTKLPLPRDAHKKQNWIIPINTGDIDHTHMSYLYI